MENCDVQRRNNIPVLYTSGTFYEVGYDVGKTFRYMIQEFLQMSEELGKSLLPAYASPKGKDIFDECLASLTKDYPQYVRELEGVARGANVPFYKLFLLHLDQIIIANSGEKCYSYAKTSQGCSTVCISSDDQILLGHTEDALPETLNHCYIVSAHIKENDPQGKWMVKEERFSALCYAGHLPGFCMGHNSQGLVFSVNVLNSEIVLVGKTPRHFITRALLSATNMERAQQILRDSGRGSADGFSVNMTFLKQEGDVLFHNVEVGPAFENNESRLSVLTIGPGEHYLHCNKYLRLQIKEVEGSLGVTSSDHRHTTLSRFSKLSSCDDVKRILGDQSDASFSFFREGGEPDFVKTICTGIFDCVKKTWSFYIQNPKDSEAIFVMPISVE